MENEALEVFELNKNLLQHQEILSNGYTPFSFYETVYTLLEKNFRKMDVDELRIFAAACRAMLVIVEGDRKQSPPPRQPFRPRIVK